MLNKSTPPDTSYAHDVDNRLLTAGDVSFGYDDNGMITKTLGGNVTNYTWDFNDMLTQLTNGGNSYEYRYDGLGGRRARIENSVEKRYVFGLAETDAGGNITAYYVYGLGLISKITPSNQSYFYHYDGIGSTVGISDSSGSVVNEYAYDAFGKVLNQVEAVPNPFRYVGQFGVTDEGNGLLYMRARFYDPEVGRFINKDPIGFMGGLNLYAYVGNNPINREDPFGLRTAAVRFNFTFITADFTIGAVWDDKGNIGIQITPAMGLSVSAGVTVGFTVTDAPCIDNLNGMGTVAGVAASVPYAGPLQFEFGHVWSGWPTPGQYANSSYTGWDFGVLGVGIGLPTPQVFVGPTVIIPVYRGR